MAIQHMIGVCCASRDGWWEQLRAIAGSKGTSWVKLRGARAPHHECVEHNQNKNERDLLRSMFGDRTRKDKNKRDVLRFAFGRRTRLK